MWLGDLPGGSLPLQVCYCNPVVSFHGIAFETAIFRECRLKMLACNWFKHCHDNAAKDKLQNFSSQNHRQKFSFCSVIWLENPYYNVIHPYKHPTLTGCRKCECWRFKTVFVSWKQFVFQFIFRDARIVLRYHLCSSFSLEKKFIVMLFYYFVDPGRLKKIYVDALIEFILFH